MREYEKSAKQVLIEAREMVVKGWCQGAWAENEDGLAVDPGDREACAWCITGALRAVAHDTTADRATATAAIIRVFPLFMWADSIINFNDYPARTKAEVLTLFDRAIEEAERLTDGVTIGG